MDLHRAAVDERDGREEEDVAVFVLELPVGQIHLPGAVVTQDDDFRAEVVRADDADDAEVADRVGVHAGGGRARFKSRKRRIRGGGGSRFQVAVVPEQDRPRHAGGDQRVQ
ncbi:MAG: hypothetical protein PGMFKBFP_01938 [Anaerolineales bacterium]|nr:hypothetical protein [Anaerolineales bacterium]